MKSKFIFIILFILFIIKPTFADDINLAFQKVPNQPYFESQELMIDAEEYSTVVLRLKANESGTGRLFWAISYDPQFNQPKSLWFSIRSGEHNYYFNVPSQNPNWIGWVKKLLVVPDFDPNHLEIISARSISGNLLSHIASGWQEFWGPNGRVVIGSTINLIPSSAIFGISINVYLYGLIVFFFLVLFTIALIQSSKKYNQMMPILAETAKKTLIFSLLLWVVLALNSNYNYFNIFKIDYSKYSGKNIEEKRSIAYGKELYDFLAFCKTALPKGPVTFGVLSTKYAPELQARIYLIPHAYSTGPMKDIPYFLVFYPSPDQAQTLKNYAVFARMNANAYIARK